MKYIKINKKYVRKDDLTYQEKLKFGLIKKVAKKEVEKIKADKKEQKETFTKDFKKDKKS